jgi:hypothetical protein
MKKLLIGFLSFMLVLTIAAEEKEVKTNTASENAAAVMLSGTVTDSGSGELLVGVEISIENTGVKTYTDFDGKFTFENITPGEYKLVANYISYNKRIEELTLDAKENKVNIKLENPQ